MNVCVRVGCRTSPSQQFGRHCESITLTCHVSCTCVCMCVSGARGSCSANFGPVNLIGVVLSVAAAAKLLLLFTVRESDRLENERELTSRSFRKLYLREIFFSLYIHLFLKLKWRFLLLERVVCALISVTRRSIESTAIRNKNKPGHFQDLSPKFFLYHLHLIDFDCFSLTCRIFRTAAAASTGGTKKGETHQMCFKCTHVYISLHLLILKYFIRPRSCKCQKSTRWNFAVGEKVSRFRRTDHAMERGTTFLIDWHFEL